MWAWGGKLPAPISFPGAENFLFWHGVCGHGMTLTPGLVLPQLTEAQAGLEVLSGAPFTDMHLHKGVHGHSPMATWLLTCAPAPSPPCMDIALTKIVPMCMSML